MLIREHLIHADAASQHGAFHQRHAGKNVAGLAGMNADADRGLVEQAVDDIELRLRNGASGSSVRPSSIAAPVAFAHQ